MKTGDKVICKKTNYDLGSPVKYVNSVKMDISPKNLNIPSFKSFKSPSTKNHIDNNSKTSSAGSECDQNSSKYRQLLKDKIIT